MLLDGLYEAVSNAVEKKREPNALNGDDRLKDESKGGKGADDQAKRCGYEPRLYIFLLCFLLLLFLFILTLQRQGESPALYGPTGCFRCHRAICSKLLGHFIDQPFKRLIAFSGEQLFGLVLFQRHHQGVYLRLVHSAGVVAQKGTTTPALFVDGGTVGAYDIGQYFAH